MRMPGNFELPSLAVECSYDEPAVPIDIPGEVSALTDPGLAMLEGGYRPHSRACRFVRPTGMIGIQLPSQLPDRLRLALRFVVDQSSEERWQARQTRNVEVNSRRNRAFEMPDRDTQGRHRVLRIDVQGQAQAHVVLATPASGDRTVQQVVLNVPSSVVDSSGLLLLGLAGAEVPWPSTRSLYEPLVGVALAWLRLKAAGGRPTPALSTGLQRVDGWSPWCPDVGFACLNGVGGSVRLDVNHVGTAASRPLAFSRKRRSRLPSAVQLATADAVGHAEELVAADGGRTGAVTFQAVSSPSFIRLLGPDGVVSSERLLLRTVAVD